MSTQHFAIRNAIVALLQAAPAMAEGNVYGGRSRPITSGKSSAVVVRLERSASQLASVQGGRTSWSTLIAIECYGRTATGTVDAIADELVAAVFARLDDNPSLGGLAMDTEPLAGDTLSWDVDELDTSLACITARFVVKHQTTGRTLTL